MKKNYIAPAIETVEIEIESLMLTDSVETDQAGTSNENAGNGPEMTNGHRGSWGSLWD